MRANVWRTSELAVSRATTMTTGHVVLDRELPNGGWPRSALVELLVQQHGIGEMQLLKPALASLSRQQRAALIQPPYLPHAMTCRSWRLNDQNMLWLRPKSSADALWSAEQIIKNGSCGAVVLWQSNVRPEALRRLNLAAQTTDTWLWLVRPLAAAADASVSPLRIALQLPGTARRPAQSGRSRTQRRPVARQPGRHHRGADTRTRRQLGQQLESPSLQKHQKAPSRPKANACRWTLAISKLLKGKHSSPSAPSHLPVM